MRISDWSSDVCSSDLTNSPFGKNALAFCSRHRAALCFSLSSELGSDEREITPTIPAAIGNPPTNVRRSIWRPPSYAQIVHTGTIRLGAAKSPSQNCYSNKRTEERQDGKGWVKPGRYSWTQ